MHGIDLSRVKEDALRQCGFAAVNVRRDADVAHAAEGIGGGVVDGRGGEEAVARGGGGGGDARGQLGCER